MVAHLLKKTGLIAHMAANRHNIKFGPFQQLSFWPEARAKTVRSTGPSASLRTGFSRSSGRETA
jgi:hypothetical protein